MDLIKLQYHKMKLKSLMMQYHNKLTSLSCGYAVARHIFDVQSLEKEMDEHIKAINKLDNKDFKTFKEGYTPSWRIN